MRKLIAVFLLALATTAQAYEQPELDALLAPIALYPDGLVNHILVAAAYPDQVSDAARGVPAQPHWHPSVTALLSYPDLLQRMAESRQWMHDLSQAYITQQASVLQTVQALRSRAQAYGHLPPEPAPAQVVYVRYYDPLVVYGPWWWPAHRPVFWRPWHHHHVVVPHHPHRHHPSHAKPVVRHAPSVFHQRIPESQRRPIVSSTSHRHAQRAPSTLHNKRIGR